MSYTKTTWRNNQAPAINADNLNHMEQGIESAHNQIGVNTSNIESLTTQVQNNATNIASEISARQTTDSSLQSQIDQLVAPTGEAPTPAEIENARIGDDGVTYDTLGNAIRGQFSDLKSDLNRTITPINLFNKTDVTRGKYLNASGVEVDYASALISNYFPCSVSQKFITPHSAIVGTSVLCLYDVNKDFVIASGGTKVGDYTVYTVPSNYPTVAYGRINSTLALIDNIMIIKGESYPAQYVGFDKTSLKNDVLLSENIMALPSYFTDTSNLYDPNSELFNGYWSGSSIVSNGAYRMTQPILLEKNVNYVYPHGSGLGTNYTVPIVDSMGNYLNTYVGGTNSNGIITFKVTIDAYVMVNIGLAANAGAFFLCKASTYDGVSEPYGKTLSELILPNSNFLYANLVGKKACYDGDSICYGNGYVGGYGKIIADNNKMSFQNLGVGGGTIAAETYSGSTPRHWICRDISNLDSNADYVIIEGGVNDGALNVPLGSLSSGMDATLDDTTFYGALESMFKQLIIRFTGKKIGFIIPHQMLYAMSPNGAYYNAVIECARKWGVPLLDLAKEIPPFGLFPTTGASDLVAIRTNYTTSGDGWHPTEVCYKEYYVPKISSWMNSL